MEVPVNSCVESGLSVSLAVLLFNLTACSDDTTGQDAGGAPDATLSADAGDFADAGVADAADASTEDASIGEDAGPDELGAPGGESDVVFMPGIRQYRITVAEADWDELNRTADEEQYVPADLDVDGVVLEQIGIRYKGNYSLNSCVEDGRPTCDKLSMKLKFSEYVEDQRLHGLTRLNFNAAFNDASLMRTRLAFSMYAAMGVPTPRTAYAQLYVNDEYLGLFVVVEAVDGRFSRARSPDGDGNVYKEVWPGHSSRAEVEASLRSNRAAVDVSGFEAFGAALNGATDETFEATLAEWVDVDQLLRTVAVDRLVGHWDGPISAWYCFGGRCRNHNYFWYESVSQNRAWLVPWDMNDTFKPFLVREIADQGLPDWNEVTQNCDEVAILGGTPARPPSCDDFIHRLGTIFADRYDAALQAAVDGPMSPAAVQERIDFFRSELEPFIAADENGPGYDRWDVEVNVLDNFANELREMAQD